MALDPTKLPKDWCGWCGDLQHTSTGTCYCMHRQKSCGAAWCGMKDADQPDPFSVRFL